MIFLWEIKKIKTKKKKIKKIIIKKFHLKLKKNAKYINKIKYKNLKKLK